MFRNLFYGSSSRPRCGSGVRRFFERLEERRLLSADLFAHHSEESWPTLNPDQYDTDSILVRFRDDVVCVDHGCSAKLEPNVLAGTTVGLMSSLIPGLTTVELAPGILVADALEAYRANPGVLYAEPNYHIQLEVIPDDTDFTDLWGLNNIGQTGGTLDADIDASEAWDVTTGSGNTIVAVIDTGVDYTHPDLQSNIWVNSAELNGSPFIDDDGNGFVDDIHGYDFFNNDGDPMDDHNHGTHVAGTIGAVGDNALGVTGVNWDVQIMAVKFLDANGAGNLGDAIDAIDYAVANGATISNNSWGFNGAFSPALHDAILNARDAGHIFSAAAGNGDFSGVGLDNDLAPFFPSGFDLDNVVSVAALDHNDALAAFSNFGLTTVDLGAPGFGIFSTTTGNTYSTFSGTSMATPHVTGVIALVRDLHPLWSYEQVIDAVLETVDPVSALEGRSVTGGRLNADRAVNFAGPEIRVLHDGLIVADGIGSIDFGNALIGLPAIELFTVKNVGLEDLQLGPTINVPAGFSVPSSFGTSTLSPGDSTTFQVAIDALALGNHSGQISFQTNDSDESLFDFSLTGTVSTVLHMDDQEQQFSTSGQWTHWLNEGLGNDMTYSAAGNGSDVATWDFGVTPGQYAVAATWSVLPNRANDAPYTIRDGTSPLATVRVDQELAPDDLIDQGVGWENLGVYTIVGNSLQIQLSDDANEFVIADGIRIERLGDLPPEPEVEVRFDGVTIADEVGSVDFGTGLFESTVVKDFTIRNIGSNDLIVDSAIEVPAGFTLVSGPLATTLAAGESTTLQIALDTSSVTSHAGQISINSNDADENPYNFAISGSVVASHIVDDGGAGFTSADDWTPYPFEGFQGDVHYAAAGTGANTSSWVFDLAPGQYRVAATWTPLPNRATNAPYTLYEDGSLIGTVSLNQEISPDDFLDQGGVWEVLGDFNISGSTLTVELSDAANEFVIADAVRIERLDLPPAPEVELFLAGATIEDETGNVNFGSTVITAPVMRTFTVSNTGGANLTLSEPIIVPAGFSVISSFGATTLTPGSSTTFKVQLEAAAEGTVGGQLSFGTNDADEGVYNITLIGSVKNVLIIDDGDSAFSTSGEWTAYNFDGFESDFHYSLGGSGSDQATWTFGVAPGQYQVAATWTTHPNRATDVPFTIRDGANVLSTVGVNQELAPDDFTAGGAVWENIGTFLITGNTLIIELTDDANEYVIADAIRVERLGDLPAGPEIVVQTDGIEVADDVGLVDFGTTSFGVPVSRIFTVLNAGSASLTLDSQVVLPAGFTLAVPLGATNLAPGESTTFEVQLDGLTLGSTSGALSLATNDPDENPFNFSLTGNVTSVEIIDNGDAGFSSSGEWTHWLFEGYDGDMHYSVAGTGADTATWTFAVTPGQYEVAATWTTLANRATNSPYTILDDGNPITTVLVNQELDPDDIVDQGVGWKGLGTHIIHSNTLTVVLTDAANEYLIADAIRIERLGGIPTGPEIVVELDGMTVADESGEVDFGTTNKGVAIDRTFLVKNVGIADLTLGGSVSLPTGFSVSNPFGSTLLAPGETTTFTVQLDAGSVGVLAGQLSFASNDSDETTFNFSIEGVVENVQLVDDGDVGFSTSGGWLPYAGQGLEGDVHYEEAGDGSSLATWEFPVSPGDYQVAVTWSAEPNRATDAPFTVFDDAVPLVTIDVNQELTPNDFSAAGVLWQELGVYSITGSTLVVQLSNDANEYVIADGIRIEHSTSAAESGTASADFNSDGVVSGFDFLRWQRGFGTSGIAIHADGDANHDGFVDNADRVVWEIQYFNSTPKATVVSAPVSAESISSAPIAEPLLARNDLVDVALAVGLASETTPEEDAPPLKESSATMELSSEFAFRATGTDPDLSAFKDLDEFATSSVQEDEVETQWLTDELLERVFG